MSWGRRGRAKGITPQGAKRVCPTADLAPGAYGGVEGDEGGGTAEAGEAPTGRPGPLSGWRWGGGFGYHLKPKPLLKKKNLPPTSPENKTLEKRNHILGDKSPLKTQGMSVDGLQIKGR